MTLKLGLVIISNILVFIVYAAYFRQIVKKQSTPDAATWIGWFVVMLLNTITYFLVVGKIYEGIISLSAFLFIAAMLFYSWKKEKFGKLNRLGKAILIAAAGLVTFGLIINDVKIFNALLQVIVFIAFIPTAEGVRKGRLREKAFPWALATVAYAFQIAAILIDHQGDYYSLGFPLANGVIGNGYVAIIIIYCSRKRT